MCVFAYNDQQTFYSSLTQEAFQQWSNDRDYSCFSVNMSFPAESILSANDCDTNALYTPLDAIPLILQTFVGIISFQY